MQDTRERKDDSKWLGATVAGFLILIISGITLLVVTMFEGPIQFGAAPT